MRRTRKSLPSRASIRRSECPPIEEQSRSPEPKVSCFKSSDCCLTPLPVEWEPAPFLSSNSARDPSECA
jgi:hypothetical protein